MAKIPHRKHKVGERDIGHIRFEIFANWPKTQWFMAACYLDPQGKPTGFRASDEKSTKSASVLERWQQELAAAERHQDVPMPAIVYFKGQRHGSRGSAWNPS